MTEKEWREPRPPQRLTDPRKRILWDTNHPGPLKGQIVIQYVDEEGRGYEMVDRDDSIYQTEVVSGSIFWVELPSKASIKKICKVIKLKLSDLQRDYLVANKAAPENTSLKLMHLATRRVYNATIDRWSVQDRYMSGYCVLTHLKHVDSDVNPLDFFKL